MGGNIDTLYTYIFQLCIAI